MENYKEKYEQALERARVWKEKSGMPVNRQGILDDIFPELKESEDEKIKNEIIDYLKGFIPHHDDDLVVKSRVWIAWLEKQSKENTANKVEPKFHASDFITDGERIFQIKETVWERNNRNDGITYCESLIVNLRDGNTYVDNTDLKNIIFGQFKMQRIVMCLLTAMQ